MPQNRVTGNTAESAQNPRMARLSRARRFSVAPMMDWSDRHCRYLWRLLSKHALLYTEMVTTGALLHGDTHRFLDFNSEEHPVALQLGGSDAKELAQCSKLAEQWGYDEVNLNCGCPSDRVQNNLIGAILMAHPNRVADCIKAMQDATSLPVTVKHRIGIDDMDDYQSLTTFVETLADVGCQTFIVHARKAWLQGLSPKQNREIPPLRYELVRQLKSEHPELTVILNGGITTLDDCVNHLNDLDGVMVGREAYSNPYLLAEVDRTLFGDDRPTASRKSIAEAYFLYCERQVQQGERLNHMAKHLLGLFQKLPGARRFRRHLSENMHAEGASCDLLYTALEFVKEPALENDYAQQPKIPV